MKLYIFSIFTLALLSLACTEKISISPVYTNDTDWAPELTSVTSGYGRMNLGFNSPPRLELFRMVEKYVLAVKKETESSYTPLATNSSSHLNTYFQIDSILALNQGYQARVSVHYRGGTVRHSNALSFHSPEIKGSIIKRIPLSDSDDYEYDFPLDLTPGHGGLYGVFLNRKAVFIDTLNGTVTPIANKDYTGVHVLNTSSLVLTVYEGDNRQFRMDYYNILTLEMDSSKYVTLPQFTFNSSLYFPTEVQSYQYDGGNVIYLNVSRSRDRILVAFNIHTAEILETSAVFSFIWSNIVLEPVGEQIWTNISSNTMDHRASLITFDDPNILTADFYSPVDYMAYFVSIENDLWAYEWNKEMLVKFIPEAVE